MRSLTNERTGYAVRADLGLISEQSQVGFCVGNGDASGLYVPGGTTALIGWGYCVALSNETQNASTMGLFLMKNRFADNGYTDGTVDDSSVLVRYSFTPEIERMYEVSLNRNSDGSFALFLDGVGVGIATEPTYFDSSTFGIFAAQDSLAGFGGYLDDIGFDYCSW